MQRKYWLALWLAAALLLFAGNGSLLITDSVEANYALTAKEMIMSGDWLSPQIYGHYWYDKPVLFYWLTAAGFKLFGFTEFAARFFPALLGLAALGLVVWAGSRLGGERRGFFSGVVLLSSVEFFLISKSVITDAALFLFVSASLLFFYLGYCRNRSCYWYLMYASAALAVLTKGPIGVLLPGLIIAVFLLWQRDWRVLGRMQLLRGALLFALLAVPWYAAMYYLHGDNFLNTFFGVHNFLRAAVSEHPKDNVFYYYTLVNLLALFPWSGLALGGMWRWWQQGRRRLEQEQGFLVIWAAVVFLFFQCMATKYITYTYPLLFPVSLLLGGMLERRENSCSTFHYVFVSSGFALLLAAAAYAAARGLLRSELLFLLPLSLIIGILLAYFLRLNGADAALGLASTALAFYLALIFSLAVPLSQERSAKGLGQLLASMDVKEAGLYGKYPASAVFYSGARLVKLVPQQKLAAYRPGGLSWRSKNVMPYAVLEEEPFKLVVLHDLQLEHFLQTENSQWRVAGESGGWLVLARKE